MTDRHKIGDTESDTVSDVGEGTLPLASKVYDNDTHLASTVSPRTREVSHGAAWRAGWRGKPMSYPTPRLARAWARGRLRRDRAISAGLRFPGDGLGAWSVEDRQAVQAL